MLSRSHRLTLVLAVALVAGLSAAAWAAGDETAPEPAAPAEQATPPTSTSAAINGATITWNIQTKRFEAPTPEQAAGLAEAMQALLAKKAAAGKLPIAEKAELEELPNGLKRMRMTADMLNFSLVRVGASGELIESCVDGPERADAALATPVTTGTQER